MTEETNFEEHPSNPPDDGDDDIITWDDFVSNQSDKIVPQCGGFVLTDDDNLLAFNGTKPNKVNIYSYDPSTKKCTVKRRRLNKSYQVVKGPVNNG